MSMYGWRPKVGETVIWTKASNAEWRCPHCDYVFGTKHVQEPMVQEARVIPFDDDYLCPECFKKLPLGEGMFAIYTGGKGFMVPYTMLSPLPTNETQAL